MSKAFTKETETEEAEPEAPDAPDPLPQGFKNYVTPNGLRLLRDELDSLRRIERPKVVEVVAWAAANGDRSENGDYIYDKKRLREIDRRLRFLLKRLESAEVVDPAQAVELVAQQAQAVRRHVVLEALGQWVRGVRDLRLRRLGLGLLGEGLAHGAP